MIVVHVFLFFILATSAYVQLNDPDPLFWVVLYCLAAAVPLLPIVKAKINIYHGVCGIALTFCLIGIGVTCAGGLEFIARMKEESLLHGMSPDKPFIEEARELFGTLIALAVILGYWLSAFKKDQKLNAPAELT